MGESCWIMISALATAAMAVATFATLVEMKKQQKETMRARLLFSIVFKDDTMYFKIANVGNSVATDIRIQFSQNFKDMLISEVHRARFETLEQTLFSIDARESKYYSIIPAMSSDRDYFTFGDKEFTKKDVIAWHKQYNKEEFEIEGSYCWNYTFKERMSVYTFLNVGSVEINEVASVLRGQNEILKGIKKEIDTIANKR